MVAKVSSFYIAEFLSCRMKTATFAPIVGAKVPEREKVKRKAVNIYEGCYLSRISWVMPGRCVPVSFTLGLPVSMKKQHPIREAVVVVDDELEIRR